MFLGVSPLEFRYFAILLKYRILEVSNIALSADGANSEWSF